MTGTDAGSDADMVLAHDLALTTGAGQGTFVIMSMHDSSVCLSGRSG